MEELLWLGITGGASVFGYLKTRAFVRDRLRFVDGAHRGIAPVLAGLAAAVVATPLALLPVINGASALLFGVGVGLGARKGSQDVKRLTGG